MLCCVPVNRLDFRQKFSEFEQTVGQKANHAT